MEDDQILKLVELMNQQTVASVTRIHEDTKATINRINGDLHTLIEANQKLMVAEIGAVNDLMTIQFREVIRRQDHTNGNIEEHTIKIKELENKYDEQVIKIKDELKPQGWIINHWKLCAVGLILLAYLVHAVIERYSLFDLIDTLKKIFGK